MGEIVGTHSFISIHDLAQFHFIVWEKYISVSDTVHLVDKKVEEMLVFSGGYVVRHCEQSKWGRVSKKMEAAQDE